MQGADGLRGRRNQPLGRDGATLYLGRTATIGASPSGKAADFGSAIPRFESWRPSHRLRPPGFVRPGTFVAGRPWRGLSRRTKSMPSLGTAISKILRLQRNDDFQFVT